MQIYFYKQRGHVVTFFERLRRWTRRPKFTTDYEMAKRWDVDKSPSSASYGIPFTQQNMDAWGLFYAIVSPGRGGRESFYTGGTSVRNTASFSSNPNEAIFFLDKEAAEETLRTVSATRCTVQAIYLDLKNTLPEQRFIVVCENVKGELSYFVSYDKYSGRLKTSKISKRGTTLGFRECLNTIEELRFSCKGYKYSMLHEFPVSVNASHLPSYIGREHPASKIALSFRL